MSTLLPTAQLGVLLFAHGARNPQWRAPFDSVRALVVQELGAIPVELAFLEFMEPDFLQGIDHLVRLGANKIQICLLFLAKGNHTVRDVQALIDSALQKYPYLKIQLGEALFENPAMLLASARWVVDSIKREPGAAQISEIKQRISAGLLVEHEDRLLMVHAIKPGIYDFWAPPGGGVQGLEDLRSAAERETREETGIHAKAHELLFVEEFYQPGLRHIKSWFHASYLGGQPSAEHPQNALDRIAEVKFMTREEITACDHYPEFLNEDYWALRESLRQGRLGTIHYRGLRPMRQW